MKQRNDADRSTEMILHVGGVEIPDIKTFSFVSDVMQLACPFSAEIPDPTSKWSALIRRGTDCQVYLRNPDVNNGAKTLKLTGRVESVKQGIRQGTGRVVRVTGFDLGWHLLHDCGTLGFWLSKSTYSKLLAKIIRPSWGFKGVRSDNSLNRQISMGRAQKLLTRSAAGEVPLQFIGIEPGEQMSSLLTELARFDALLLTVSADGYLQAWNPDYDRSPEYHFELYPDSDVRRHGNNIEDVEVSSTAAPLATDITCCGELLINLETTVPTPDKPHPGRKEGLFKDRSILPFVNSQIYTDTEQFDSKHSSANAEWTAKRNMLNSWSYQCSAPAHHQSGKWFCADMICGINDLVNHDDTGPKIKNVVGAHWIQAVEMHWDKDRGGGTSFVIRKPGLLKAPVIGRGGTIPYDRNAKSATVLPGTVSN